MNIGLCVHIHEAIQWHHFCSYSYTACFRPFSIRQVVPGTEVKLDSLGSNNASEGGIYSWDTCMKNGRQELAALRGYWECR